MRRFRNISNRNRIRKRFIRVVLIFSILFNSALFAHHGAGHASVNTGALDPFSGRALSPSSYLMIQLDYTKDARNNKNIYTTNYYGEATIGDGTFSINGSVPHVYYQQKDREDAARIGKPYAGGKANVLRESLLPFFVILDARIGFPTGPDEDHYTKENFWDGAGGVSLGVATGPVSFGVRIGGQTPLSRLKARKSEYEGLPEFLLLDQRDFGPGDDEQLRKVTEISSFVTYRPTDRIMFYAGYYFRNPYNGIVWENPGMDRDLLYYSILPDEFDPEEYYLEQEYDPVPRYPATFHEVSAGFSVQVFDRWSVNATYRYPLHRTAKTRLYESAVSAAITYRFGAVHYHDYEGGHEHEEQEDHNESTMNE